MILKTCFTSIVNLIQPPFICGNKSGYAQRTMVFHIAVVRLH